MIYKEDKFYYKRNFNIALIFSLVFVIILFYFFPSINHSVTKLNYFLEPVITVINIPKTGQPQQSLPPKPIAAPISSMLLPIDELELLEDVKISDQSTNKGEEVSRANKSITDNSRTYEASTFPLVPRQLIEVVPEKVDGAEGSIKIKFLIGKDGFVKKHSILNNITTNKKCVENVIAAVYKSKWQPIVFEGEKVEYWLEKTYTFN